MPRLSIPLVTSTYPANTSAEANSIPLRDADGGVTHESVTTNALLNGGAETAALTAIKTGAYTIGDSDRFVYYDTTGGAFAITFPLASARDGRLLTIVNASDSTTALTLTMSGGDTCTDATLTTANGYATYQSDGVSKWTRVG